MRLMMFSRTLFSCPESTCTTFTRTKSKNDTKPPSQTIEIATTTVESLSSLYFRNPLSFGSHGQEHFCSSTFTSLKKVLILVNIWNVKKVNRITRLQRHRLHVPF